MNIFYLHPIPHCSLNLSSPTISPSNASLPSSSLTFLISKNGYSRTTSLTISAASASRSFGTKPIPARDKIIDFGKYRGKMLGTLPSKYLIWVSKNLRARDFEEWAKLADEVLSDPVYGDRIEWEFAQNVLHGDVSSPSAAALAAGNQNAVSNLLEISTRFGWDNDDKLGWSKIDFELLGTSKGGRIPKICDSGNKGVKFMDMRTLAAKRNDEKGVDGVDGEGERDSSREKRRERQRRRNVTSLPMEETMAKFENTDYNTTRSDIKKDDSVPENRSRFPGREALLKKALSLHSRKQF